MSIRSVVLGLFVIGPLIVATGGSQSTPDEPVAPPPEPKQTQPATAPVRPPGLSATATTARQTLADAEQLLREGDWVGARAQFSVISPGDLAPADVARYTLLGRIEKETIPRIGVQLRKTTS